MTGQGQQSAFNPRSDQAAQLLRQDLNNRLPPEGRIPESAPVAVGPDGKPPAPLAPEGSYARMAHDQQQAQLRAEQQAAAQEAQANLLATGQPTPQQVVGQQPPAGTPLQQSDGSVAPPLAGGQPQPAAAEAQPQAPQLSENANTRIQQLVAESREKDRQIAEFAAKAGDSEKLKQQVQGLLDERASFLEQNLESMDPEQRAAVLADARMREILDQRDSALLQAIDQRLAPLQQRGQQSDMERTAAKFPGFDMQIHPNLIDTLRAKVPGLTYEMAFKAVAEGDEAVTREQASAVAVPPVVSAGAGPALPRYMPEPTPNPEDALVDYQQRTNKLIASDNPADQRQGYRQLDIALRERLSGASYENKPSVFD